MARFRGYLEGARGSVSRLGHATSGLTVIANGWDSGVKIIAGVENNEDVFYVYRTSGSNGGRSDEKVAIITARGVLHYDEHEKLILREVDRETV